MSKIKNYAMTLDEIIEAGEELVASYKKTASTAEIILNAVKELKDLFSEGAPAVQEKPATNHYCLTRFLRKRNHRRKKPRLIPSLRYAALWLDFPVRGKGRSQSPA